MDTSPDFTIDDCPPAPAGARPVLRGMTLDAMKTMLAEAGFEAYRAKQLYHWVFARGAASLDEMKNLPGAMRAWLAENARLGGVDLIKMTGRPEGAQKALFRCADGHQIESVIMRDDDNPANPSFCVSSQAGCALGCAFCMTGFGGFVRHLNVDEIVGQAIELRRLAIHEDNILQHLVFMGMGEPMHNLDAVIPAIELLTDPNGFGLSRRRVTVSTAGMVDGLHRFGEAGLGVGLAVSLNATTDEVRDKIMPVNRRWPICELIAALRRYPLEQRRRITIEYVLMRGVNDAPEDARRLVKLVMGLRCKVNLIMYNVCGELEFQPVEEATLERFMQTLSRAHVTVAVRWSKGFDIQAACGQLAGHARKESQ